MEPGRETITRECMGRVRDKGNLVFVETIVTEKCRV